MQLTYLISWWDPKSLFQLAQQVSGYPTTIPKQMHDIIQPVDSVAILAMSTKVKCYCSKQAMTY